MAHWGWPQFMIALLMAFQVIVHVSKHDEPRKYDGPTAFIDVTAYAFILYMGGFWS